MFYLYSLKIVDDWFDLELLKDRVPLVILPSQMEVGWRKDLLEMEYNSLDEESYSSLPLQQDDIGASFERLVEEVRIAILDVA